jgi:uncharacterized membrane protein YfcA
MIPMISADHILNGDHLDVYRALAAMSCFVVVGMSTRVVIAYERKKRHLRRRYVMLVGGGTTLVFAGAGLGELALIGSDEDKIAWFVASFLIVSAWMVTTGLFQMLRQMLREMRDRGPAHGAARSRR